MEKVIPIRYVNKNIVTILKVIRAMLNLRGIINGLAKMMNICYE
ncbi:MAG: hypothetical protein ACO2OV_00025 [Thermoproteota archaeon]|jgi:hypothetical protein